MINKQLEQGSYTPPQCRMMNVRTASVLCGSVNASPDIIYDDDPFILS